MNKVAIIGTGFSSLVLAGELKKRGDFEITFFEKSRGVGGRIATRYNEDWEFDHGCPFFEARNSEFINFLEPLIRRGVIAKWNPTVVNDVMNQINEGAEYYIGIPKMNSLPKLLSGGFNIKLETKITKIDHFQNKWKLIDENYHEYGLFDIVITSTPPVQAYDILPDYCSYKNDLQSYEMLPQFVCIVGLDPLNINFDIMQIQNSKIEKIVLNNKKNGRSGKPSVVVYFSMQWSEENINMDKNQVGNELLGELENLFNTKLQTHLLQTHRWLYSKPKTICNLLTLFDDRLNMFSCGDWLSDGTIEGAFLSGIKTAQHITCKIKML